MVLAERKVYVEESEMDGLTPPNSPKYCKSCILFAGLKSFMTDLVFIGSSPEFVR
jgi:hypothetical protein